MGNQCCQRKQMQISSPVITQIQNWQNTNKSETKTESKDTETADKSAPYDYSTYKSPIERQREILAQAHPSQSPYTHVQQTAPVMDNSIAYDIPNGTYSAQRRPKIHGNSTDTRRNRNRISTIQSHSKNVISSSVDIMESTSSDQQYLSVLTQVCELLCIDPIPSAICAIIHSYVWTSAVIINKTYPSNLSQTFAECTSITHIGQTYKHPLNIVILGCNKSGKTNIVSRYYVNRFSKEDTPSEAFENRINCHCKVDGVRYNVQVVDTGTGFGILMRQHRKEIIYNAHCMMIVFDGNSKQSYQWIHAHIEEFVKIKKIAKDVDVPLVIVATKIDMMDSVPIQGATQRVINIASIKKQYCMRYNAPYIECSAKNSVNIDQLFQITVQEAMTFVCNFR
eukprot:129444_1